MGVLQNNLYMEDIKRAVEALALADFLDKSRILITGATGMIGTALIDMLMYSNRIFGSDIHIAAMGRSAEKAKERFAGYWEDPCFTFIEHDINHPLHCADSGAEPGIGSKTEGTEYIIHAASTTHPLAYAQEPVQTITVNVIGLYNLLKYAAKSNVKRLAFLSSVEVYGENRGDVERFKEDYCGYIDCNTVRAGYPESKRVGEALCQSFAGQYGTDVVIPRLSRVYGPTMWETDSKAIAQFIKRAVEGENIILKSNGSQLYSYCYVTDAAAGILKVLLEGKKGEAYNISDRKSEVTLKELAGMLARIAGTQVLYDIPDETERAGYSRSTRATMDTHKTEQLGWTPLTHMEEGLYKTVRLCRGLRESG